MAETQRLGATKNIMYRKFYFFIIMFFVACCLNDFSFDIPCLSFTLALIYNVAMDRINVLYIPPNALDFFHLKMHNSPDCSFIVFYILYYLALVTLHSSSQW